MTTFDKFRTDLLFWIRGHKAEENYIRYISEHFLKETRLLKEDVIKSTGTVEAAIVAFKQAGLIKPVSPPMLIRGRGHNKSDYRTQPYETTELGNDVADMMSFIRSERANGITHDDVDIRKKYAPQVTSAAEAAGILVFRTKTVKRKEATEGRLRRPLPGETIDWNILRDISQTDQFG